MSSSAELMMKSHQVPLIVKLADNSEELEQMYRLRYEVFVEEENANLVCEGNRELDKFDSYCDHLIVKDLAADRVVGTYRLLPGTRALQQDGFNSETEFDLTSFTNYKWNSLELGRSCVHRDYRNGRAIQMLWEGLANYINNGGYRFLVECASVHIQEIEEINEVYGILKNSGMVTDRFGIQPLDSHRISSLQPMSDVLQTRRLLRKLPPLLKGYYSLGAEIGGEPAFDAAFGTTDFFVVMETSRMTGKYKRHFFRDREE